MTKKRIAIVIISLVLALGLALCVFLTACGGDTVFNIPQTSPATDEDFQTFMNDMSEHVNDVDTATGLPAMLAGNTYELELDWSISYKYEGDNNIQKINMRMSGWINLTDDISGSFTTERIRELNYPDFKASDSYHTKTIETIADGVKYTYNEKDGETTKYKEDYAFDIKLSGSDSAWISFGGFTVPKSDAAEFVTTFRMFAEQLAGIHIDEATMYIYNDVLKIDMGGGNYAGVALDSDSDTFEALAFVIEDFDGKDMLSSTLFTVMFGLLPAYTVRPVPTDVEASLIFNLRSTDYNAVTAPADSAEYAYPDEL